MARVAVLAMLQFFMVLIFGGWLLLWLLRPTKFWIHVWQSVESGLNTPAYGRTGADILFYSAPVVLLAILGAAYLHLRGTEVSSRKRNWTAWSSFPVFIRGPLGFVSVKELLISCMLLGIFVWTLSVYIANDVSHITPKMLKKSENHHLWQHKLERVGIRLGSSGQLLLALLFLPVTRGLTLLQMIGIHFELAVKYHIWLGNATMIIYTLHALCFFVTWGSQRKLHVEFSTWSRTAKLETSNIAGLCASTIGMTMWLTSINPLRRRYFEIFYYTHQLYAIFIVFFLMHIVDRQSTIVLGGMFLFVLDRFIRLFESRRTVSVISARIFPCRAIELTLPKLPGLQYTSTSAIFLKIPLVSQMQWHPFTITSSSNISNNRISVLIKCQGLWTDKLYDIISSQLSDSKSAAVEAVIEGPYGPHINYFARYSNLVLIAGGSGITPFVSILQYIFAQKTNTRVRLIFSVKRREELSMLCAISPSLLKQNLEKGFFSFQAHITQEQESLDPEQLTISCNQFQSIRFETHKILPPFLISSESNIWKAAIYGLSFGLFILLLGVLNGFLLDVGNEKAEKNSPLWQRALIIVVAAIIGIGTAVFTMAAWKWKSYICKSCTSESLEETTESFADDENEDFESLTCLLKHGHVKYGRPNFKGIFSSCLKDTEGSTFGVLVCGPTGMQEALAYEFKEYSYKNVGAAKALNFHRVNFVL